MLGMAFAAIVPFAHAHAETLQSLPADGASQVSRVMRPSVRLPAAQTAAGLTSGRLELRTPIGTAVAGVVTMNSNLATFEPAAPLAGCTRYTLEFTLARSANAAPLRSRFTTACSDWTAPTEIDDARTSHQVDRPANGVQLAASPSGDVVAAWFQNDGERNAIEVSRYTPATDFWSAPQPIDLRSAGAGAANIPALVADAQGRVTAVWFQSAPSPTATRQSAQGRNTIQTSRLNASGNWSPPQRLDKPELPGDATNPQLAANTAGDVAVVWQQPDGHHTGIFASRLLVGSGHWLPAIELDHGSANAYSPVVAATADGGFSAAWQQGAPGHESVFLAHAAAVTNHASRSSNWAPPRRISPAGVPAQNPVLTTRPQGQTTIAWVQGKGAARRIATQQWSSQGRSASRITRLQNPAFQGAALAPALVSDAAGNITLAWEQADVALPARARYAILASRFDANTQRWSAPVQLDDPKQASAGNPVLVADAAGNVTAAWYQDGPRGMQVQAVRYDPSTARWSAAILLSDTRTTVQASFPALAVDAAGSVTAAWQQYNGWRTVVMASRLP